MATDDTPTIRRLGEAATAYARISDRIDAHHDGTERVTDAELAALFDERDKAQAEFHAAFEAAV